MSSPTPGWGRTGTEYVTHLLHRTYPEGGKVRNETVGNISHLPAELVELVRRPLRGERFLSVDESFQVEESLPHGHVERSRWPGGSSSRACSIAPPRMSAPSA